MTYAGITNHINHNAPLEAVIFDFDDTLISWAESDKPWWEVVQEASADIPSYLRANNIAQVSDKAYLDAFNTEMRDSWGKAHETYEGVSFGGVLMRTLDRLEVDGRAADIQAIMRHFNWQPGVGVQPFPDAHDVLDGLRERGLKIGLLTNAWQPMWMREVELEKFGLVGRLDAKITSGDTGYIKPHPAVFWRILGMLNTVPDRAIMVGDNPTADIRGGNFVGMTTVQMKPEHLDRDQQGVVPDHTITSLSQLLPIVDAMLAA